ncbi:MAG: hypothetical protein PVI91_01775 [Gammaproteobacteria bacterium]|jgi:plastocyanin
MAGSNSFVTTARNIAWLISLGGALASATAAEVRGTVRIDYQGLFEVDNRSQDHPVSVALFPDRGQRPAPRRPRTRQINIVENRMHPAFITIQKGDRVSFVNHDAVFHQLFSLSSAEPVSIQLGKADGPNTTMATLAPDHPGTTHVFCRIHHKSYARIDVVATPHMATVQPGEQFHFGGLAPGRWRLRLASPAAETQWLKVTALTTPPPLSLTLISHGGGSGTRPLGTWAGIEDLYR